MPADRTPVLQVDDNPADLRLLAELLEEAAPGRFRVEPARSLSDGLDALRARPFSAVILDLSLPDADGVAAVGMVRQAAPSTPVIVLTGMLTNEIRRAAAEKGAAAAFVKADASIAPLIAAIDELTASGA